MTNNMCRKNILNVIKSTNIMLNSPKYIINIPMRFLNINVFRVNNYSAIKQNSIQSYVLRKTISSRNDQKIVYPNSNTLTHILQQGNLRHYCTKKEQTPEDKSEQKSDKKEEPKGKKSFFSELFSNENAWKVGLASIALMGSFMIGQLLIVWG